MQFFIGKEKILLKCEGNFIKRWNEQNQMYQNK